MTVFLTGISGLLGTNIALLLIKHGYTVKALLRNPGKFNTISHHRLHIVQGDLMDDLSVHLYDVETVLHAAAETRQNLTKYADYYRINYTGTVRLTEAAIQMGVKKFIYISTANTIGYGLGTAGVLPEPQHMMSPFTHSFYARSKASSERYVLAQKDRIIVHVVNPSFMIGAYDSKPGSGKIVLMGMNKHLLFYPPGGKNFIAVTDVAAIVEKCINFGENGKRYLATGENISYADFFKKIRMLHRRKQCLLPIPFFILKLMGLFGDILRYLGLKTNISSVNMRILSICNYYNSSSSATSMLKLKSQPISTAIEECMKYFNTNHAKTKKD